jgi:tRNA A37 threonylcarbamoyladenosine synthetase subunit TsaC/SUA5/YrdC
MVASPDYDADAARVFECLQDGGIAIVHMDVAYAIMSGTEDALRRVYAAKARSYDRPSGVVANHRTHREIQIVSEEASRIIDAVTVRHDLPMSVIAPYRKAHPLMSAIPPFLTGMSTKDDTVNFLLNASPLRGRIAELSLEANFPLMASSANRSQQGTKYRAQDIEAEVRDVADVIIDYGPSKYLQEGYAYSSTQIDFRTYTVVRKGVCYDRIAAIFMDEFGIELRAD